MSFLVDALAAYRLTRLVTADKLLDTPRARLVRRSYERQDWPNHVAWQQLQADVAAAGGWAEYAMDDEAAPKLATLVTCRWCAGMWVSLGVVAARRAAPTAWAPLARALAFSAGAALLARLED